MLKAEGPNGEKGEKKTFAPGGIFVEHKAPRRSTKDLTSITDLVV